MKGDLLWARGMNFSVKKNTSQRALALERECQNISAERKFLSRRQAHGTPRRVNSAKQPRLSQSACSTDLTPRRCGIAECESVCCPQTSRRVTGHSSGSSPGEGKMERKGVEVGVRPGISLPHK